MMILLSLILFSSFVAIQSRPEMYRENEDFQYSRSSSSDGSKSGYYGAQRGNMGGNYEKAHNMDNLAQHQMSSVIGQLEGELGDASKSRMGSIKSAASTRGVYGSGNFDLSNLHGRNFQEGSTYDDSLSHSSMRSHNSAYNSHSSALSNSAYNNRYSHGLRQGGYQAAGYANELQSGDLQSVNNLNMGAELEYDNQASQSSKYLLQSTHRGSSDFNHQSSNLQRTNYHGFDANNHFGSTNPVKIILRPGTKVVVPVSYENGHDLTALGHSSANSDVEVIANNDKRINYIPTTNSQQYESAYSYKKEWEKRDEVPLAVISTSHVQAPKHSELFEDNVSSKLSSHQYQGNLNLQNSMADHAHEYSNVKTASGSSKYNANHISQNSQLNENAKAIYDMNHKKESKSYVSGISEVESEQPKSYQSSYSYHKSWERQGDPYVIKPVQASTYKEQVPEKLIKASLNHGHSSSQYEHSHQDYSQTVECDDTNIN